MPHIRIRGMSSSQVQELSHGLAKELATVISTSADNFTIEHVGSQFFTDGQSDQGYPLVEVLWFERPADIKQKVASHLTERIKQLTQAPDVAVIFLALEKTNYFENARHF